MLEFFSSFVKYSVNKWIVALFNLRFVIEEI